MGARNCPVKHHKTSSVCSQFPHRNDNKREESPGNSTGGRAARRESELDEIRKAQAGDAGAFAALYDRYKRRVGFICLKMSRNATEAEDLTQEAFIQVFRKLRTYRGESAFSTWLHRVAVNVVLMHFRRSHFERAEVPAEELLTDDEGAEPQFGEEDRKLDASLDRVCLEYAIERLPPGYRMVLILHDIEGYEHNEIAEVLGCSIGNSKSQLHKARLKIRNLLLQARRRPDEPRSRFAEYSSAPANVSSLF